MIDSLLDGLEQGKGATVEFVGEAGIGKTRLLHELGRRAEERGQLVLAGAAAEFEADLPFAAFVDALDQYVAGLEPARLASLDLTVRAELAHVFPSLWAIGDDRVARDERSRSHRAVRSLLELIARARPLVLVLDDLHWADAASAELLGALLRHPPARPVLVAVGRRPWRSPARLATTLDRANLSGALVRVYLEPLTPAESREILGRSVGDVDAATLIEECGGNPFYLEQLARSVDRAGATRPPANDAFRALDVPPAVAASLREEVGLLSFNGRVVLEGAAVAGDPFDPELTSAAARLAEAETIEGIDELLRADLVRTTEVPRRFRFRHPIVRRAAYAGTAPAWRMGAHERCAGALAARGASAAARAHHVERSARPGDAAALALLRAAGEEVVRLAPDSAATWFAAAIRLLPDVAPGRQRIDLLLEHAGALAAAGRFADSHEAMLTASTLASRESPMLQTRVATACASAERMLGRYEQAHRRLADALLGLPGDATSERAELLIELTLNEFYRSRYDAMRGWAAAAVEAASTMGEETLVAASVVMEAFADAMTGPTDRASASRARAAQLIDALPDAVLSERPDAAGWLAIGEVYLDRYADAEAHASRALALSRLSGRGDPLHRLYPVLPRVWYVRGKLAAAAELLDAAIETGRLLGSPPSLAGNLFNRSAVALAMGDLATARSTAEESVELTRNLDDGFVPAWAGARLAEVLHATGQSDQAIEILLERAGGPEVPLIPAGWRAHGLELLTRCFLASGRRAEAGEAAGRAASAAAETGLPLAAAWANRATAAVALETGDAMGAVDHALTSAAAAEAAGAPIEAALSRTLGGRALRAAGCPERAVVELVRAAEAFDACGARRYRDSAERELGALGHRPHRRTRRGTRDGGGIESLTQRELDVALLVVDLRTNREIATNLVLSEKTIETHLRNIFNKVGVDSRTDLARAIERSRDDPGGGGRPDTTLQAH